MQQLNPYSEIAEFHDITEHDLRQLDSCQLLAMLQDYPDLTPEVVELISEIAAERYLLEACAEEIMHMVNLGPLRALQGVLDRMGSLNMPKELER